MNTSAEIAAIKRRLAALEAGTPGAVEARRQREAAEEAQRTREAAEATRRNRELREANERQSIENWRKHEQAEADERKANGGLWRDPTGIWRTPDGRQASVAHNEQARYGEVSQQWKEENQK